ncbi:hypothetical protein ABT072_36700 [Streptomyces sp. NPDC002589]
MAGYLDHHGLPQRGEAARIVAGLPGGSAVEAGFDTAGRTAGVGVKVLP